MKFWKVEGVDPDTMEDVDGFFTSAAEEDIPDSFEEIKDRILYYEVEDVHEVRELASEFMMYTFYEVVLFSNKINYN